MTKTAIIANMAYVSPTRSKKGTGRQGLHGKLRYFQYRDDHDGHIPQEAGLERWYDRGLGKSYGAIYKNCLVEQSQTVLAWTWMLSPAPQLMALVPEGERHELIAKLTDEVVETYYEARGLAAPDYSFVIHDRETKGGQQQPHSHVVLTGMVYDEDEQKSTPVFNAKSQGHMKLFDEIANKELAILLDRSIGPSWRLQLQEQPEQSPVQAIVEGDQMYSLTKARLEAEWQPEEPPVWSGPSLDL